MSPNPTPAAEHRASVVSFVKEVAEIAERDHGFELVHDGPKGPSEEFHFRADLVEAGLRPKTEYDTRFAYMTFSVRVPDNGKLGESDLQAIALVVKRARESFVTFLNENTEPAE